MRQPITLGIKFEPVLTLISLMQSSRKNLLGYSKLIHSTDCFYSEMNQNKIHKLGDLEKFLFDELADKRLKDWFLMSNPNGILAILFVYVLAICLFLPRFMKNRKPYNLKSVIFLYNTFQIIANATIVYGLLTSGWTTTYSWTCQTVDYTHSNAGLKMLSTMWFAMLTKIVDLLETLFFVLRKKQNQVSVLHLYHHISTVLIAWVLTKYFGGGFITLTVSLNSFIHVLMYTYYLVSSFGQTFRGLSIWKQTLTTCQIVQFVLILLYVFDAIIRCNVSKFYLYCFAPYIILNMVLFLNFYWMNYLKRHKTPKKTN